MHQSLSDRVLFVDDDDAVRHTFARSMRKAGIPCDIAENASKALDFANKSIYCVVATDYAMPGKNGLELRHELRELQPDATFVLISAQCSLELALEATNDHGFSYVLTKPWRSAELHSLMNRASEKAWERTSARMLAKRSVGDGSRTGDTDHTALLASVSSIVSQVCGTSSPELQRRTERFRALSSVICDAMHVRAETRRDLDMASVVLAASLGDNNQGPDASVWLPSSGPFTGARIALEQVNERWDGQGSLKYDGESIDLRAQILAVLRLFDFSMTAIDLDDDVDVSDALDQTKEQLACRVGSELAPHVARALMSVDAEQLEEIYRPVPQAPLLLAYE